MGPRHEEGLDSETNFFIQCENEKEEPTDYKKDKVEGDQILDAIGSTKFISFTQGQKQPPNKNSIQFGESIKFSDAFLFW